MHAGVVRKKRDLAKDLEGIDTKNVIETDGRRPRRAAAAAAVATKCASAPPRPPSIAEFRF